MQDSDNLIYPKNTHEEKLRADTGIIQILLIKTNELPLNEIIIRIRLQ